MPVLLIYGLEERKVWPTIAAAGLGVLLICATSWLGVLAVVVSFSLYLLTPGRGYLPKACVFGVVIAGVTLFSAWKGPQEGARLIGKQVQKVIVDNPDKLFGMRGYIWDGTAKVVGFLPKGPGRLAGEFPHDRLKEYKLASRWRGKMVVIDRPHNVYLQIAHAFGVLGLLFYMATSWALAVYGLRNGIYPPERAFCTGCWVGVVGFSVAGFLNDGGPAVWPVYAVVFAGAVAGGWPPWYGRDFSNS